MSRSRKRVNYCEESGADEGGGSGKKRVAAVNSSDSDSIEFVEERKPVKKAAKKATTPKVASSTSDLVATNSSNEKFSAGESINTNEPTSSLLFGDIADKSDKTEEIPSYNVEVACSGRAQCRRCNELIPKNNIRVGIEAEGDWGLFTKWHHLNCTIFHKSITNSSQIRGYDLLDAVSLAALDKRVSDSLNEVDKDATPLDPDELVRVEWNEQMNPPSDLLMPLLPFQKEGLGWMVHQEDLTIKDNALGGILADEMGMGKTIQTISLILTNRPPTATASSGKDSQNELTMQEWQKSDVLHNSTYALNPLPRGATLIIVPTIAIRQWQAEILRFTKSKSLIVRLYHGSDRECSVEDFAKADVVITSYKIVEIEYRKATQNIKVTCSICNKNFYPEKLRIHRKYFCGESAQRTVAQSKTEKKKLQTDSSPAAAAAASPVADAEEEEDEISKQKKANKKGKKNKNNDPEDDVFEDPEVERDILDAMKEYKDANRHRAKVVSIMHMISWFRIVLDEAHVIKDRSTSTAKAVYGLVSLYKWCLSGTPLQNRVSELYSLVRFLRIDPYAYYQCKVKSCNCKSLHYRFTGGKCDQCQHGNMVHYSHFNKHILNPIKVNGYKNEGRKALLILKNEVLDKILLRRTKITRADDIQLPPRIVTVKMHRLDHIEDDYYQALYTQSKVQFNHYVAAGTVLNNYAHIFDILIRLRQAADHPYLVIYNDTKASNAPAAAASSAYLETEPEGEEVECGLCNEPCVEQCSSKCNHTFCRACITDYIVTVTACYVNDLGRVQGITPFVENEGNNSDNSDNSDEEEEAEKKPKKKVSNKGKIPSVGCPKCLKSLVVNLNPDAGHSSVTVQQSSHSTVAKAVLAGRKKSILHKIDLNNFQSSTKMEALMQELHRMQQADLGSKAIVFSQFVNMLDLLKYRLERGGFRCLQLLGHMSVDQRDDIISQFKQEPGIKVLLISLKAGGVALNLTVASHIFIMDPWWNGSAELQAIDRTHRIGQHRPIFATRFIIENTIEERILKLQEKKQLVIDGTIGGDSASMAKLTVDDMRFLFQ